MASFAACGRSNLPQSAADLERTNIITMLEDAQRTYISPHLLHTYTYIQTYAYIQTYTYTTNFPASSCKRVLVPLLPVQDRTRMHLARQALRTKWQSEISGTEMYPRKQGQTYRQQERFPGCFLSHQNHSGSGRE